MYRSTHTHTHGQKHTYTHMDRSTHTHTHVHKHTYTHTWTKAHIHMDRSTHTHTWTEAHIHTNMYTSTHTHTHMDRSTHTHTHGQKHTYTHTPGSYSNRNREIDFENSAYKKNMTHTYVRHDSFICETWLMHMWDMTHLSLEIVISTLDIVHTRKTAPATLRTPKPTQRKYTPNHIYTHTRAHTCTPGWYRHGNSHVDFGNSIVDFWNSISKKDCTCTPSNPQTYLSTRTHTHIVTCTHIHTWLK